jgi:hypothetical protein
MVFFGSTKASPEAMPAIAMVRGRRVKASIAFLVLTVAGCLPAHSREVRASGGIGNPDALTQVLARTVRAAVMDRELVEQLGGARGPKGK